MQTVDKYDFRNQNSLECWIQSALHDDFCRDSDLLTQIVTRAPALDNMEPKISKGARIIIDYIDKSDVKPGVPYLILFSDNDCYAYYVSAGKTEGHWNLISENKSYGTIEIPTDKIRAIFKITLAANQLA